MSRHWNFTLNPLKPIAHKLFVTVFLTIFVTFVRQRWKYWEVYSIRCRDALISVNRCWATSNLLQNLTGSRETTLRTCGESWLKVDGGKDGLPEFSTNHQAPHRLQHWLMKYLSRQSHITCFSCPPHPRHNGSWEAMLRLQIRWTLTRGKLCRKSSRWCSMCDK